MEYNLCEILSFDLIFLQLEDYKIAQKEQERQIEKEIIKKEKDLCNLKHFRVRCVEIVSW